MWLVSIGALQGSKTTFILRRARSVSPQGNAGILPNIGLLLVSRCLSCEIDEGPGQFNEYAQKEGKRTSYVLVKLRQVRRSIGLTTIRVDAMSVMGRPAKQRAHRNVMEPPSACFLMYAVCASRQFLRPRRQGSKKVTQSTRWSGSSPCQCEPQETMLTAESRDPNLATAASV